jgi:hypothetical protein
VNQRLVNVRVHMRKHRIAVAYARVHMR